MNDEDAWATNIFDKIRESLEIDVFRRALQNYDLDLIHVMLSKNPKLEEFFYQSLLIELINNSQSASNKNESIECIDTAIFIWKHNEKIQTYFRNKNIPLKILHENFNAALKSKNPYLAFWKSNQRLRGLYLEKNSPLSLSELTQNSECALARQAIEITLLIWKSRYNFRENYRNTGDLIKKFELALKSGNLTIIHGIWCINNLLKSDITKANDHIKMALLYQVLIIRPPKKHHLSQESDPLAFIKIFVRWFKKPLIIQSILN